MFLSVKGRSSSRSRRRMKQDDLLRSVGGRGDVEITACRPSFTFNTSEFGGVEADGSSSVALLSRQRTRTRTLKVFLIRQWAEYQQASSSHRFNERNLEASLGSPGSFFQISRALEVVTWLSHVMSNLIVVVVSSWRCFSLQLVNQSSSCSCFHKFLLL